MSVEQFQPALDVFESQAPRAFIQFFKIRLCKTPAVVVQPDEKPVGIGVLGHVNKTGIAVFQYVIHQFLDNPEDDEFLFCLQAVAVVVKARTGVDGARAAYLLEQVIYSRLQPEIFKGGWHQAMRYIADKLDGIVDNLLGVVNALQLGGLVKIDQVFVEVEAGGGQQGAGIVVQVGRQALAFLFLQAYRGVQEDALLLLLHALEGALVADYLALVENNEYDKPYGQRKHTDGPEEHDRRDAGLMY